MFKKVAGPEPRIKFSFKDLRAILKENLWLRLISGIKFWKLKSKNKKVRAKANPKSEKITKFLSKIFLWTIQNDRIKIKVKITINQPIFELTKIRIKTESKIWNKKKIFKNLFEIENRIKLKGKRQAEITPTEVTGPIGVKEEFLVKLKGKINFWKIWSRDKSWTKKIESENKTKREKISFFSKRFTKSQ